MDGPLSNYNICPNEAEVQAMKSKLVSSLQKTKGVFKNTLDAAIEINWKRNMYMFWAWESVVHHMYFIYLFIFRQFEDRQYLHKLNLLKECEFLQNIFRTVKPKLCAESSMVLFSGLWFNTSNPDNDELAYVGRTVTNYQNMEAIFHFWIVISGLHIIYLLNTRKVVPVWLRWSFFGSLFVETWIMCVPYMVVFDWTWQAFDYNNPTNAITSTIANLGTDKFIDGTHLGAAIVTFWWVSFVVLILDGWAMYRAWCMVKDGQPKLIGDFATIAMFLVPTVLFSMFYKDFFDSEQAGNIGFRDNMADYIIGGLHSLTIR